MKPSTLVMVAVSWGAVSAAAVPARAQRCTFDSGAVIDAGQRTDAAGKVGEKRATARTARGESRQSAGQAAGDPEAALAQIFRNARTPSTVIVKAQTRLTVTLTNPPPTRLRVSFDSAAGQHAELEWDPAVSSDLARDVTIGVGTWTVSVAAEPSTFSQQSGTVAIQARFSGLMATDTSDVAMVAGVYVAAVVSTVQTTGPVDRVLASWPQPSVVVDCRPQLPAIDDLTFASGAAQRSGAELRGFGVAPAAVTDTLALLAEIAIDRARSGALKLLKKRLVDPFCVDKETRVSLARLRMAGAGGDPLALPRTCELLASLRIDDVLSSGRPLLIALRDDLRLTIAPAAAVKIADGRPAAEQALLATVSILNTVVDHGGIDGIEGQLLLDALGAVTQMSVRVSEGLSDDLMKGLSSLPAASVGAIAATLGVGCAAATCTAEEAAAVFAGIKKLLAQPIGRWRDLAAASDATALRDAFVGALAAVADGVPSDATTAARRVEAAIGYGCQARLVVATVKHCSKGDCSAGDITGRLTRPHEYFAADVALPQALCWRTTASGPRYVELPADGAAVQRFVLDGLRMVAPVVDSSGRDRAKAAVRLAIQLLQRSQRTPAGELDRRLEIFGEVVVALIDEDYGTAFGQFLRLAREATAEGVPDQLTRVAQLIGAVASYATVYRSTKDDDPAAAREARTRALSSIIDSFTDRTDREGQRIVSLGSNVGLSLTRLGKLDSKADGAFDSGLRVPLQVSLEWLPGAKRWYGRHFGFRLGVQLADLGQFVRSGGDGELDDVAWADFVSPGVEAGVLLGFLGTPVNLSVHAAYAPSLKLDGASSDGVWRYGAAFGFYVPFFDLR